MNKEQKLSLDKPVLVTGASGFMGSHVTRLLVQQGRKVRVLVRKTSNTQAFADLAVEIFYGDVLQPETLHAAIEGCCSIFYNVLDPRFWLSDPEPLFRNNVEGLVNTMDIALSKGIERFIFTSSMGTLGFNPNGPVTEEIEFNWYDRASPYFMARLKAEQELLRYSREKGLPGMALCIANTYGPQDFQPTPHNGMLGKMARGQERVTLDACQPTIDIRDAAEAALLAERYGRVAERYIIANEYISNREFFTLATELGGQRPPIVIPQWFAYGVAWMAERFYKLLGKKDNIVSTDAVYLSNCFKVMDSSKARTELGWSPRPISETIADAVAWFNLPTDD
ncbi:NAD-dependent epimerase/dehydratase family protein [Halioxenophilus sp. WMMB6]|uniref:NAD-dependent epimerase/dehydratase family protein n=1 Tax=Halioxenophilus sp. WMMB6 TaxID=3073815 RepID=UPI00295EA692|nr:NAD-dependent epimerase/dehydratase family protein [Halioxenophilus sp. WMMB6]